MAGADTQSWHTLQSIAQCMLILPGCRVQLQVSHVPGHCIMYRGRAAMPGQALSTGGPALHRWFGICLWRVLLVHGACSPGGGGGFGLR